MNFNKLALPVLIALVYAPVQVMAACSTPSATGTPGTFTSNLTVFAKTYVTAGASSVVKGDVISGDVLTIGASARVNGSITSVGASNVGAGAASMGGNMVSGGVATVGAGGAIGGCLTSSGAATIGANASVTGDLISGGIATTGDSAKVGGNISSGGYASIGANSQVTGTVAGVGATVIGAGGTTGSLFTLASSPITPTSFTASLVSAVSNNASQVANKQNYYSAMGMGTGLGTTMTTSMTLTGGGVFSAANFTTTAGMTLTLNDQGAPHDWVFNIADYLVTGASTNVVMMNPHPDSTVTWNVTNGYVALGASNNFLGTILANQYISVGASATVKAINRSCGIYSAASYVSTGASAVVEGGCRP